MSAPSTPPEAPQAAVTPNPGPVAPEPAPSTPPASQSTPATPAKRSLEDSLASLDEETRTYVLGEVQRARKEAGDARGNAKKQAADDARKELAQQIGKAIGLVEDETPDPTALTEQLTTQTAAARQAQVELAVYRASVGLGADPAALLDSVTFVRSLADVDPTDAGAVQTAITAALEANPALKTPAQRRLPGPNPAVGSSADGPPGLDAQIAAAKKAGDVKTWLALENQKLAAPSR